MAATLAAAKPATGLAVTVTDPLSGLSAIDCGIFSGVLAPDEFGNKNAMARRLGVMYIIFNRKIWRAYDPGWGSYSGTNPHTDHIHISLSYDGSTGRTSYWKGKPLGSACSTGALTTSAPPVETDPMRYVPVAPTRLATTDSGTGMLNGPCRLVKGSGQRVDVQLVVGIGRHEHVAGSWPS